VKRIWLGLACLLAATAGAEYLTPGENLLVEGIPPIPRSVVDSTARYTESRAAVFTDWHPVEREMVVRTRFADTFQLHHVAGPGMARRQLTFFEEPVSGASYQPTDGGSFTLMRDTGGNEFHQLYRFDPETLELTLLTDGEKRHGMPLWANSGEQFVYRRVDANEDGAFTDLLLMDPARPEEARMLVSLPGGGWGAMDWAPGDSRLLAMEYRSVNESYLLEVDVETGEQRLLTEARAEEGPVAYGLAMYSKDGAGLYTVTDRGAEFMQLTHVDLETLAHTPLTAHIPWDVETFDLSESGALLAYVTNEAGISRLHLLDTATREARPLPEVPEGVISGVAWHRNGRDLAFTLSAARTPSDVYVLDVETGALERWTSSETGMINPESFPEAELISWTSVDDLAITGFLYQPPARFEGPRPVIINIHGGPEAQARPRFLGRFNYFMNELGAAMIYPNVRGSSGYGKQFLQLDNGLLREGAYEDIRTLLDWIDAHPGLDGERVLVTGGSYGGHMSLIAATRYSDRIACAISIVGISHLRTFLENTEGYRRDLRRVEYGDERDPEIRAWLDATAPLSNAADIQKPLFVVHGKNDPRVPVSEAEQIVRTLQEQGTPVWSLIATDEGHGFARKANADFQFYATVLFMQEFLLP